VDDGVVTRANAGGWAGSTEGEIWSGNEGLEG
jgi:hypothetical protein